MNGFTDTFLTALAVLAAVLYLLQHFKNSRGRCTSCSSCCCSRAGSRDVQLQAFPLQRREPGDHC